MKILITGGTGYIGSHMVRLLISQGHTPIVIDSLEFGHPQSIPSSAKLYTGNVNDINLLNQIFETKIDAIIHFAGYTSVPESVKEPQKYFDNNLVKPISLLNAMVSHNVKYIIFSSTAAVYGQPLLLPIPENHPKNPTNPYGLSKYFFEQNLKYFDQTLGIKSISLRYFNACGASSDGQFGEDHNPEGHLIPNAIQAALLNQNFTLFGQNYPTSDGTCIRDYIHLDDLCSAHLLALDALANGHESDIYNVGTGIGTSNLQIVNTIKSIVGDFQFNFGPNRPGDPSELVADSTKLQKEFNWKPSHSSIENIISTAHLWHSTHPKGYTFPE